MQCCNKSIKQQCDKIQRWLTHVVVGSVTVEMLILAALYTVWVSMSRFSLPQGLLCNLHLGGVLEYQGLYMSVNQQLAVAHNSVMDCITDSNVPSNLLYPQIWVSTFLISHVSPWSFSRPNMRRVIKKKIAARDHCSSHFGD